MDPTSRRFIAVVVVVLVLLAGLMGALVSLVDTGGPGGDGGRGDGWHTAEDLIIVDGDATWSDWYMILDRPVQVVEESSLLIEDSHIVVPIEDLVFGGDPAFTVRPFSSIEIRSSSIEIDYDERLDDAWVSRGYGYYMSTIWRAVDLREAVAPLLELDVELRNEDARLGVAVQPTPEDDLIYLAIAGTDVAGFREWSHLQVSLADYAGGTPRVVVFVMDAGYGDALVSGLNVDDRGLPLPGDVLGTGDLDSEGWSLKGFRRFRDLLTSSDRTMAPLLFCDGADVVLVGSQLYSVLGLGRSHSVYHPQLLAADEHEMSALLPATSLGGEMNVSDGTLTILDANVSRVPILASRCDMEVRGSGFTGDNEMLTLHDCSGSVKGCYFTYEEVTENRGLSRYDDALWQLGVEDTTGREDLRVDGCAFRGTGPEEGKGNGLHLNHADIVPVNCSFDDLDLAIWKHGGDRGMTWGMFSAHLTMGEECGQWYVDTEEVLMTFDGVDKPSHGGWGRWSPAHRLVMDLPTPVLIESFDRDDSYLLCPPTVVAGPDDGVRVVENVTVFANPHWAVGRYVSFDPHDAEVHVLFGKVDESAYYPRAYIWTWHAPTDVTGVVRQDLEVYLPWTYYQDYEMLVYLDGDVVARPILNFTWDGSDELVTYLTLEHALSPGFHVMTITLTAVFTQENERLEAANLTIVFLRLDGSGGEWDLSRLTEGDMAVLVVDPGVDVEGLRLEASPREKEWFLLGLVPFEDSRLGLESISFETFYLWIDMDGPGDVVLGDVRANNFDILLNGTHLVCLGTLTGLGGIDGVSCDVRIEGDLESPYSYCALYEGSSLSMVGAVVENDDTFDVILEDSDAVIEGCTFRSDVVGGIVYVSAHGNSTARVVDCTFSGLSLRPIMNELNGSFDVRGCDFEGEGAYLLLLGSLWYEPWAGEYETLHLPPSGEVSDNSFSGERAGIVFDPVALVGLLGSCDLTDGAQAMAFFAPNVTFVGGWNTSTSVAITIDVMRWNNRDRFYRESYNEWLRYLVDVTDDLSSALDIGSVPGVVLDTAAGNYQGTVVAFTDLPVASGSVVLRVSPWPSLEIDTYNLTDHHDNGWWEGD